MTRDEWPFPLLLVLCSALVLAVLGVHAGLTLACIVAVPLIIIEIGRVADQ